MARLFVPLDLGEVVLSEAAAPFRDIVMNRFRTREVLPRIDAASRRTPLFIGLTDEQRAGLLSASRPLRFHPGDALFRRGDDDGVMHLILGGKVELISKSGRPNLGRFDRSVRRRDFAALFAANPPAALGRRHCQNER